MTGVVHSIGEDQDEIAGGRVGVGLPLIAAGGVEGIEESGGGKMVLAPLNLRGSDGDEGVVVGPALGDERFGVEQLDESAVVAFAEQARGVGANDGAIEFNFTQHGIADIEEETGADGQVFEGLEQDDVILRLAVVGEREVAGGEAGEGLAVCFGGVEGEGDFVDGDMEGVGRLGWRCGRRCGLGRLRRGDERQEEPGEQK